MKHRPAYVFFSFAALTCVLLVGTGCQQQMPTESADVKLPGASHPSAVAKSPANLNGAGGELPAYYDAKLFTINFTELSSTAEKAILAHNRSYNFIYTSDTPLAGNQLFVGVLDAIPHDGFNPLWNEVGIVFNAGITPYQLLSDNDVLAAAAGPNPTITLVPTTEVYRCSVVGHK